MKKRIFVSAAFILAGFFFLGAGCATNRDVHNLNNRVSQLESELAKEKRALKSSLEKLRQDFASDRAQGEDIRQLFASQDAQLDAFRSELQKLRGKIEETRYRIGKDLDKLKNDLDKTGMKIASLSEKMDAYDKRISRLEKFLGIQEDTGLMSSQEGGTSERTDLGELGEDGLYKAAKQAFDEGDHETAVEGFELFLEKFPDSDMADNARFWIGEVFFAEKWYEKAILEYEKVIKNYPEANKVPGAYLKQGMAFHKLGENANARLILQTLIQKYPDSKEAEIAKRQIAAMD
ncbi:MAG: tol-pal system protein YbgF [Desulfobacteraceae bacterium]|nr:tol-pal system protein YbgF [Desulfobacteraceae bacterium]